MNNQNKNIHLAIKANDITYVKEYFSTCKNINLKNIEHESLLHVACEVAYDFSIAELLINLGADINLIDKFQNTPLHTCIIYGNVNVAKMLLQKECNIHSKNLIGNTPLHCIALYGNLELAQLLIQYEPDPFIQNKQKYTALTLAKHQSKNKCYDLLKKYEDYKSLQLTTSTNNNASKKMKI